MTPPQTCITGRPIAVLPRLARKIRSAARSTGFGKLCSSIPSDLAYDRAAMRRSAFMPLTTITDPANLAPGDRLQYLDAVAVVKRQIEGHAIEPGGLDFFERLGA